MDANTSDHDSVEAFVQRIPDWIEQLQLLTMRLSNCLRDNNAQISKLVVQVNLLEMQLSNLETKIKSLETRLSDY